METANGTRRRRLGSAMETANGTRRRRRR